MDIGSAPAVIIDNGTGFIKAGFEGEDSPKVVLPTLIGKPKMPGIMVGMDQKDWYVGEEVIEKQNFLNINTPITEGRIEDWDSMEQIWNHTFFTELNASPEEHAILFTESPLTTRTTREKMAHIMFEKFNVPYFYIAVTATLSLYAAGKTTGIVADCGEGITHTVPIYEGFALPHSILRLPISGKDLTEYLGQILAERGYHIASSHAKQIVTDIKHRFCKVAFDFDTSLKKSTEPGYREKDYDLPDGSTIKIGAEKFRCPEILITPTQINKEIYGLPDTIFQSIQKCDADIRKELYSKIVLAGGTSMIRNLKERVEKDVKALAPSNMPIEVHSPPERAYSSWLGGSILSMIESFRPMFITKAEYEENGPTAVYRKCF